MDLGLTGKVARVLAAGRGLGRVSARALTAEDCSLVAFLRAQPAAYRTDPTVTIDRVATRPFL